VASREEGYAVLFLPLWIVYEIQFNLRRREIQYRGAQLFAFVANHHMDRGHAGANKRF